MTSNRTNTLLLLATVLTGLGGCGGGGSDGAPAAPPIPSSGTYSWLLKASGATNALKFGLSFVHPSSPSVEYVIEIARDVVSDARLVSSGTVDTAQARITALLAHTLVYIVGGDVRSVPMQANGSAPASRIQRAQSTSACRFVIDAPDHAAPQNSRFIVSTAGADGACDTADDGRAEVRLAASGALGYTPLSGDFPLDVTRDVSNLAPRGWIYPRNVSLWNTTPATTIATRTAPALALTGVMASTPDAALVADGSRLAVLRFGAGAAVSESALDAAITAGSTWQPIGFDADHFYVYSNASNSFTSVWKVLQIARANPTATLLASGTGLVTVAGLGRDMLYLTVFGQTDNQSVRIAKTTGTQFSTRTAQTTLLTVQTGADGVHQRWRVDGVGTASVSYAIDFIDESDATLFSVASGFPLAMASASERNLNRSEDRTRFLVAGNYNPQAFSGSTLVDYNGATRTATTLGTLPGASTFGADAVLASASAGPATFGLGFAARSSGGSVQESGAKVFSFTAGVANSLTFTTLAP